MQACCTPSRYANIHNEKNMLVALLRIDEIMSARVHVFIPNHNFYNSSAYLRQVASYASWDSTDEERKPVYQLEVTFCSRGSYRQEQIDFPDFDSCNRALTVLLADMRAWEEFTTGPAYITSMEHFEQMKTKF